MFCASRECELRPQSWLDAERVVMDVTSITPMQVSPTGSCKKDVDPDAIKMFVGQVPKAMDENELRDFFGKFGEIYQLNVLRDKASGQSRGCCFVTFYTRKAAIESQDALHNKHVLPGMHHPIQMKPADNEKKSIEERKLFIGMVSKKLTEVDIRRMFVQFGVIEECTVLRDLQGVSRGCAFVTYTTRSSAVLAIQNMHHSQTMEGCASPLVVKFADTPKEKEHKKVVVPGAGGAGNIWAAMQLSANLANIAALPPQYLAVLQSFGSGGSNASQNLGNFMDLSAYHNMQNLGLLGSSQSSPGGMNLMGMPAASRGSGGGGGGNSSLSSMHGSRIGAGPTNKESLYLASLNGGGVGHMGSLNSSQLNGVPLISSNPGTGNSLSSLSHASALDAITQAYSGIAQYTASFPNAYTTPTTPAQLSVSDGGAGKQTEGPDGANLFIYHLPQEFQDIDLMQTFIPYGNIISAKVFIDKQSNLSKCFGFVSYDNPISAQAAIQNMNGFQIGMKRLKVQLKRAKNESKPY